MDEATKALVDHFPRIFTDLKARAQIAPMNVLAAEVRGGTYFRRGDELAIAPDWWKHQAAGMIVAVMADKAEEAARTIESQAQEIERLKEDQRFRLSDCHRLLRKSDVEGICQSPDLCWGDSDPARCGPCAIKQAEKVGVETDHSLANLPEVYLQRQENHTLRAERDQAREELAKVLQTTQRQAPADMVEAVANDIQPMLDKWETGIYCTYDLVQATYTAMQAYMASDEILDIDREAALYVSCLTEERRGIVSEAFAAHRRAAAITSQSDPREELAKAVEIIAKTVAAYGKPGGPWNVPSEPGTWIANARAFLAQHKDTQP